MRIFLLPDLKDILPSAVRLNAVTVFSSSAESAFSLGFTLEMKGMESVLFLAGSYLYINAPFLL